MLCVDLLFNFNLYRPMKPIRLITLLCVLMSSFDTYSQQGYQRPPEEIAKILEAPQTPGVSISPDKTLMALLDNDDYPTIEELSRPELRLAGLRINPNNFGPSRASF